ncbi:hypothetical protein B27N_01150 [Alcanivorax marinus]|nr:hypothetical protein [Alloalcanivorax marinus]
MDNMFRLSTEASKIAIDFTDIHHVLSRAGMGVSVFGKATGAPFLATQKALRSLDKMIPQSPKQFERVLVVIRGAYTSLTSYSDTCALIDSHPRITDKTLFLAGVIDDEDMKDIMEVNLTVTWHPDHAA